VSLVRCGLSPSEIEAYERDGLIFPIAVLPAARVTASRRAFEDLDESLGVTDEPMRWTNLCFPWAYDLTMEPRVLDSVETLLGPDIVVIGAMILSKRPGRGGYVSWHQDGAYTPEDDAPTVSAWIALADSTPASGCMRFIPGTHRELLPHRDEADPSNLLRTKLLQAGRTVAQPVHEDQAVDVVLRAGQMSLHHNRVLHGSRPNCGDDKRIGFIVRYTTPAMRDRGFPMVRASGRADCSHFALAQRPPERDPGAAFAGYLDFCQAMKSRQRHHGGAAVGRN
jgi:ectoine hydroxylase-related dioxygenase (phytanoyl-CoA dioxygenase family)